MSVSVCKDVKKFSNLLKYGKDEYIICDIPAKVPDIYKTADGVEVDSTEYPFTQSCLVARSDGATMLLMHTIRYVHNAGLRYAGLRYAVSVWILVCVRACVGVSVYVCIDYGRCKMDAKKVWAFIVMGGNRSDNINLFLGGFNDYKKARKCVSEMAGVYMFIEIVDREGRKLGFINNKFMWH